jgi:hypothetical protein
MPSSRSSLLAGFALMLLVANAPGCGEQATGTEAVGPCEIASATDRVRGQVAVPACNETLTGAEVALFDELLLNQLGTATTDANGEFDIALPAAGRYILQAGRGPYTGRSEVFEVGATAPYQVILVQ